MVLCPPSEKLVFSHLEMGTLEKEKHCRGAEEKALRNSGAGPSLEEYLLPQALGAQFNRPGALGLPLPEFGMPAQGTA